MIKLYTMLIINQFLHLEETLNRSIIIYKINKANTISTDVKLSIQKHNLYHQYQLQLFPNTPINTQEDPNMSYTCKLYHDPSYKSSLD